MKSYSVVCSLDNRHFAFTCMACNEVDAIASAFAEYGPRITVFGALLMQ